MIYLSQPPKKIIQITLLFAIGLIAVSFLMRIADGEYKRKPEKLEQETHDGVSDLEQYVYDNTEPYIYFGDPEISEGAHTADLYLIQSDDHIDKKLFDTTRCLINDYLESNPDYFLNDQYRITLHFILRHSIPHDYSDDPAGSASNCLIINGYTNNGYEKHHIHYDQLSVISCANGYNHTNILSSNNVKTVDVRGNGLPHDELIRIVNSLSDLEYLCITSWDGDINALIDDIHAINPNVELIWEYQ